MLYSKNNAYGSRVKVSQEMHYFHHQLPIKDTQKRFSIWKNFCFFKWDLLGHWYFLSSEEV